MSESPNQFPRKELYNTNHKPVFQPTSKPSEQRNVTYVSGASLSDLSISKASMVNASQLSQLQERIKILENDVFALLQDLAQKEEQNKSLQEINEHIQNRLVKQEQLNQQIKHKLLQSQSNNQTLLQSLKQVNEQNEQLKKLVNSEMKRQFEHGTDSKASIRSNQQVQEDIIRVNEQISNVLDKMHLLNVDYESFKQKNYQLQKQKEETSEKISILEQHLAQALRVAQSYKNEAEYSKEEVYLLKQEIHQVNQLSIRKQKQLQDEFYDKQKTFYKELQSSKRLTEQARTKQKSEETSAIVDIKNSKIRALELDIQYMQSQIQMKQKQIRQIRDTYESREAEFQQGYRKLQEENYKHVQKIKELQRQYSSKVINLQEEIIDMKTYQNRIKVLEQANSNQLSQLRNKEEKIYNLQENIRDLQAKQSYTIQLQEQMRELKNKEQFQEEEKRLIENGKYEVMEQLEGVRKRLEMIQIQVRNTNETKNKYEQQMVSLKVKIKELSELSEDQRKQIRDIETEHEISRKKIDDISIISDSNHHNKLQQLENTNRELQKIIFISKMENQTQSKKYKEILNDYKNLNEDLSTQLQLYRDAQSLDHPMCPLNNSRQMKTFLPSVSEKQQVEARTQLEKQKAKYQKLIEKYEQMINNVKFQPGKQQQFLKIDNSSLRSQITQLNIRIQQHKATIDCMRKDAGSRGSDIEKIRYSIQRQYEAKMEVQRMEIINEYNVLLRNRGVRIEPNQLRPQTYGNENQYSPKNDYHFSHNNDQNISTKIRFHPEYKKLQEEYIKMNRQLLESEQLFNKAVTQYKDEIQKLRIENDYHRKTIDDLHAQAYGIPSSDSQRLGQAKNKYEQLNKDYQKLYEEHVHLRSRIGGIQNSSNTHLIPGDRIKQMFRPRNFQISNQNQKIQIEYLRKIVNSKLVELELTPREPSSIIERAGWIIQKLSELILQLKQDRETIRGQKKEVIVQNDKLRVRVETLQYENQHLLKQFAVASQKFKYLEQRNLKISTGTIPSSERQQKKKPEIPFINLNSTNENDVYFHEARIARQQQINLLRILQKQFDSPDMFNSGNE